MVFFVLTQFIGNVILGDPTIELSDALHNLRQEWYNYISKANIKAFFELCVAPSCRIGFRNLMLSAGLGGMKPNTLILQYFISNSDGNNSSGNQNNSLRRGQSSPFHRQQSYHYEERANSEKLIVTMRPVESNSARFIMRVPL